MCLFDTSNKHCHFSLEIGGTQKLVVGILEEKDTFLKHMEIVEHFVQTLGTVEDLACEVKNLGNVQKFCISHSCFFVFVFFLMLFQFFIFSFVSLFLLFFGTLKKEKSWRSSYCKNVDPPQ